jgi:hypothetical protein
MIARRRLIAIGHQVVVIAARWKLVIILGKVLPSSRSALIGLPQQPPVRLARIRGHGQPRLFDVQTRRRRLEPIRITKVFL